MRYKFPRWPMSRPELLMKAPRFEMPKAARGSIAKGWPIVAEEYEKMPMTPDFADWLQATFPEEDQQGNVFGIMFTHLR
jgi:hypothetical protein